MNRLPLALLLLPIATACAATQQECRVLVLRPITDDIGNHWPAGKQLPVDIERDNDHGGAYCAHGGSCLPRKVGGAEALRLANCRIGPAIGDGDHRLEPFANPQ